MPENVVCYKKGQISPGTTHRILVGFSQASKQSK